MKIFKLLSVLMFVALSVGFASCSDDDDEVTAEGLVGTWESTWSEGWAKDSKDPSDDDEWKGATTGDDIVIVSFSADGKGYDSFSGSFTWKLEGNKITLEYEEYSNSGKISKLTDTEMVVESTYKEGTFESYDKIIYKRVK